MPAAVCTLFEGHYHNGVAVLINSLYKHGFRGNLYAGYRGSLPNWANPTREACQQDWPGARILQLDDSLKVWFLPLETSYHFAHYKPCFMMRLMGGLAEEADAIAYFDPDIVNLCNWNFYEKWMSHGVAMVHEVVSNDMPDTHPSRMEWYSIIKRLNRRPLRKIHSYINSGFCGIARINLEFLKVWAEIIDLAVREYQMDVGTFKGSDRASAFYFVDQDAFNIAAMCCESPISEMGPEAMDFETAGWTMSHAAGWPKPWNNNFLLSALKGNPPTRTAKYYWSNTTYPINLYNNSFRLFKRANIGIANAIGRFYKRN